jgi:hypothetical protein
MMLAEYVKLHRKNFTPTWLMWTEIGEKKIPVQYIAISQPNELLGNLMDLAPSINASVKRRGLEVL